MGDTISSSLTYSTGYGGSQNSHLGTGTNQFQPGQEGYLGYQFSPSGTAYSGWMRVIFTANQPGGTLLDWAFDDTPGNTIAAGNIVQAALMGGGSLVTLTAGTGESPVLRTNLADLGGGETSIQKNGVGTWTLGAQSYTGTTTVNAGTLAVGANGGKLVGTTGILVNNGGTLLLTNNTTIDRINDNAAITMAAGSTFNTAGLSEGTTTISPTGIDLRARGMTAAREREAAARSTRWRSTAGGWNSERFSFSGDDGLSRSDVVAANEEVARPSRRYSPTGAPTAGLGALTLQGTEIAPVTFDFGTLGGSTLIFSSLNAVSANTYVNILNWSGMVGMDNGAASNDRFLFATNTGFSDTDLANFHFIGYSPGATQIFYNGYYELVPVPEPSTWVAGILTVAAVAYSQRGRFVKKKARNGSAATS
jgi:autotransporter-associated beta strand protein